MLPLFSFSIYAGSILAKQQCNTPKSGKAYQSIDDSAKKGALSAKDPGNQIKPKQAD